LGQILIEEDLGDLRDTASSVSSCLMRRFAAASSSAWSVRNSSISPRSIYSCLSQL
jgi:hypothetical protein